MPLPFLYRLPYYSSMNRARTRRFRSDLPQTRKSGPLAVDTEDKALTRYLERALRETRSLSLNPPACPYCVSRQTILSTRPHARLPMPAFRCNSCGKGFNRLTGTPLARLRHADKLPQFIRLLSCQMSYKQATELLEVDYSAVANWAEKFRNWLFAYSAESDRRFRLKVTGESGAK
jgi:transposase-like protein